MKKVKQILMFLVASIMTTLSFAGAEKGNGQLIVKTSKGEVIPFEEFVSQQQPKTYMGYRFLPRKNDYSSPFERDYITEFDKWIEFIANYSHHFAEGLMKTIESTDFVFLDSDITFKIEDYPIREGLNVDYFKAAGYFRSQIYLSIPQMDRYTDSDRYTAEELRAFTIVHELLHAHGHGTTASKLALGTLILNARKSNLSKMLFHIEAAKLGYDFWKHEEIDFRIEFLKELSSLGRLRYIQPRVHKDTYDIYKLTTLAELLSLKRSKKTLSQSLPTFLDIKSTLQKIVDVLDAANEGERSEIQEMFAKTTREDFNYWLTNKVLSSGKRNTDGSLSWEPTVLDYIVDVPFYTREGYHFATNAGYGFLVPFFRNYSPYGSKEGRFRNIESIKNIGGGVRNADLDEMLLSLLITPYLIPFAQDFVEAWEPKDMCSLEPIEQLQGVNPLWLIYSQDKNRHWIFTGDIFSNYYGLTGNLTHEEINKRQRANKSIHTILEKLNSIEKCVKEAESFSPVSLERVVNTFKRSKPSKSELAEYLYELRHKIVKSKFSTELPFQKAREYMDQKISSYCESARLSRTCGKLDKKFEL